jgi:hypothetical protein
MSLKNLLTIGQLEKHETSPAQVRRMLESAERCIADARHESISPETRLDASYRAITQLCMVALWANGYRPAKSRPGHHQTMIQSLVHTIDLDRDEILLLETFRAKRNAIDYSGHDVDLASVGECIRAADRLMQHVITWLARNKPALKPRSQ